MPRAGRVLCAGSNGSAYDVRDNLGRIVALCRVCHRPLTPYRNHAESRWDVRKHSVPGRNTASHDSTLGIIHASAVTYI